MEAWGTARTPGKMGMVTGSGSSKDPILKVFELRATELADEHIHDKP